jgi:putative NADH-flavin reductase
VTLHALPKSIKIFQQLRAASSTLKALPNFVIGQDVIIVSVRGIVGKSKKPNDAVQRIAVENIVNVLRDAGDGALRLIHVGGAGSLEVVPGVLYADTLPKFLIPETLELEIPTDSDFRILEISCRREMELCHTAKEFHEW